MHIEGNKPKQATKVKILLAILSLTLFTLVFKSFFVGGLIFLGLFIHERGHLKAAEYLGLSHRGMYFLPGFGAVALLNEMPKSRAQECFIAMAGPVDGMLYTGFLAILAALSPWGALSLILASAALWSGVINLMNLLCPVDPLDGGRILKSITFSIHPNVGFFMLIGSIAISIYLALHGWPVFYLVSIAAIIGIFEEKKIYKIRPTMRWFDAIYATIGVVIIAVLLAGFSCFSANKIYKVKNMGNPHTTAYVQDIEQ